MEFARQGRDMLKVFIQDEASVLKRSSTGKALKNRMVKMGRTEFASIFLIGQNVSDIGEDEDVKANIGTKFAFATNSKAEAREVLKYLELNYESEELQEMLIELPTGVCLMKDIEGRVAVLEVEPLFDDLIEAFNTTPELRVDRDDTSDKTAKKTESSTVEDESINEEAIEESVSDENVEYLEVDVEAIENEGIEQGEQVVEEKAEQTGKDINNFLNEWGK
jgi:DNA segregation ATPase FtsK/SpoIIIE-like protein